MICSSIWAATLAAQQQTQIIVPSEVIDLRTLVRAKTQRQDFTVQGLAQSNGRWAALIEFNDGKAGLVITARGGEVPKLSEPMNGFADRVAMDPDGGIFVGLRGSRSRKAEITILDPELRVIGRQGQEAVSRMGPVPSETGVFWHDAAGNTLYRVTPESLVEVSTLVDPKVEFPDPGEFRSLLTLSDGASDPRWIVVRPVIEEASVFENNGVRMTTSKLDLDSAYKASGLAIPSRDPTEGVTLVASTVVSQKGDLYVFLSSVSYGKPWPVAVLDPYTGRLRKTLSVVLPTSPERVEKYNPQGYMRLGRMALDDQLVIVDEELGLLAVYSNY
jgi:hypothetical protein